MGTWVKKQTTIAYKWHKIDKNSRNNMENSDENWTKIMKNHQELGVTLTKNW